MPEKRRGRQEPTTRFTLPYQKTEGSEAIALYEESGRTAQEWQRGILYDMMAIGDDGLWVHAKFGFAVPRQNGKNENIVMREMYDLRHNRKCLHTAHRTATSRAAWERLVFLCESSGIHEIKGEIKSGYKTGKSKGQEWIEFDEEHGGGKVAFRTRSTSGGLGETYDTLVIDEAQEYTADQESALQYTVSATENPQIIYLGTPPTAYSSGTLFPEYRSEVLSGAKKYCGWCEWSVEQPTDPHDVDAWYETNPSLGFTLQERTIEGEIGSAQNKVDDFNIQRLGLWIKYNQKSAISKTEWEARSVVILPKITGKLGIGIKFATDGTSVSMSIAGKCSSGVFHETVGWHSMRDGLNWISDFLVSVSGQYCQIAVDGKNGVDVLKDLCDDRRIKNLHPVSVAEFIEANTVFDQLLYSKQLLHMYQPAVDNVVTNTERRAIGTGGGHGYKCTKALADISILDSIILATWSLQKFGATKKQKVRC